MKLKELFNNESVRKLNKISFHNQLALIIEYPSYEIIMKTQKLFPDIEVVGRKPKEIDNPIAKIAEKILEETTSFRIKGITTSWLIILKQKKLSSFELYKMIDTPIMHNNQLIGILISFELVSLENLYLSNYFLSNDRVVDSISQYKLSTLEKEILFMATLGKSSKEVANTFSEIGIREISHSTVKSILSQRIYKKLNVNTISKAIHSGIKYNDTDKIPQSLLLSRLKEYYIIDSNNNSIEI